MNEIYFKKNEDNLVCKHQFWVDRNPDTCFNCGKTEWELFKETYISKSELKELREEVEAKRMTDEQRKGDTPERMAAQLYFNLALQDVLDLIDARLK